MPPPAHPEQDCGKEETGIERPGCPTALPPRRTWFPYQTSGLQSPAESCRYPFSLPPLETYKK